MKQMDNELEELHYRLLEMVTAFQKFTTENKLVFFLVGGSALGALRHSGFIPWDDDIDIAMMRSDFEKMEHIMAESGNRLGDFIYSPVEEQVIPEAPIGYLYDFVRTENGYEVNAKIDIHPIDGVPENSILRKLQKTVSLVYYLSVYRLPVKNKGKGIRMISKVILKLTPDILFRFFRKVSKKIMTRWNAENSENICSLFGVAGYEQEIMPRDYLIPLKSVPFETGEFFMPGKPHEYLKRLYGNYMELPPEEQRHPQIHYNGYRACKRETQ